jgi:hypothetical protein
MGTDVNLTGRWEGSYSQYGRAHAITAEFVQSGEVLRGTMRDRETVTEKSVFEVALEAGLPPGADEQIEASLRAMFPDAHGVRVRSRTELPPLSTLEGDLRGRTVSFVKRYQGESFVGYQVGERRVGQTTEGHAVHYHGEISDNEMTIAGRWWIEPSIPRGTARTEGEFELMRVSFEQPRL